MKNTDQAAGYAHPKYAQSFAEFGAPLRLPRSQGWLLQRRIPGSEYRDAMGCYPIFSCLYWSELHADLNELRDQLVSVAVVSDPFADCSVEYLRDCFDELVVPFKQHFVVDLQERPEEFIHPHHRRNARKASRELEIELCAAPETALDEWVALYANLIRRHELKGLTAFSRESFAGQMNVPGLVVLKARHQQETVGMLLWYEQGEVAYYHLGAYSERGYELKASFALFRYAIDYFQKRGLHWLNLGASPGTSFDRSSGLARFKEGWSTGLRTVYFCGRVLDRRRYGEMVEARKIGSTKYFPAYRMGEFG